MGKRLEVCIKSIMLLTPTSNERCGDVHSGIDETDEPLVTLTTGLRDLSTDTEFGRERQICTIAAVSLARLAAERWTTHLPVWSQP